MRDMTKWLGDGGMPILTQLGLRFDLPEPGDGEFVRSAAVWTPTPITANPAGIVQGGIHTVILDAAIGFAVNANLDPPARLQATLEIKTEFLRAASADSRLAVHGSVIRMSRRIAFTSAEVTDAEGTCLSRASATVLLHRPAEGAAKR